MKTAIISDIHGNYDALQSVLEDIKNQQLERVVCLGDCIGYGPEPDAVIREVRNREIPTIIGNHELAVLERRHLNWFNPMARSSVEKSIAMLSDTSIAYIRQLPKHHVENDIRYVHGYPPDSARTYLFQKLPSQLIQTFEEMSEKRCFVGHTHELELVEFDGQQVERRPLKEGPIALDPEKRYIVNVGSVGQPRDGNNKAKYVIHDPDDHQLTVRFVTYDIATVVEKIKAAGLPEVHARRLW